MGHTVGKRASGSKSGPKLRLKDCFPQENRTTETIPASTPDAGIQLQTSLGQSLCLLAAEELTGFKKAAFMHASTLSPVTEEQTERSDTAEQGCYGEGRPDVPQSRRGTRSASSAPAPPAQGMRAGKARHQAPLPVRV